MKNSESNSYSYRDLTKNEQSMHEWREGESFIQSFTLLGNDEIAPITIIASNPSQEFQNRIACMDVEQLLIEMGDSHINRL